MAITRAQSAPRRQAPKPAVKRKPSLEAAHQPSPSDVTKSSTQPIQPPQIVEQSEKLARLTWELNIRAAAAKADKVEKDVKALVESTQEDKAFRKDNESRMRELWREVLATKTHMGRLQDRQGNGETDQTRLEEIVTSLQEAVKLEMEDVKDSIKAMEMCLESLPSQEEIDVLTRNVKQGGSQDSGIGEEATSNTQAAEGRAGLDLEELGSPRSSLTVPRRIKEAIASTRRWNKDHKSTSFDEPTFLARYFAQQKKRDPRVAVHIQKGVLRIVRARTGDRPQNMRELCCAARWADVTESVDKTLGRSLDVAAKLLAG